ncbi:lipase family protein [Plantactinospora sonchi]|uniref:Alpha/beta hydrolase n=1 Tax=Plantactinospora sonchi TaxID=1544735 RepID=A0ABU7RNR4_9ACTN
MVDPEFQISGGAGGVGARYDDIGRLARQSEDLSGELAEISARGHGVLVDPDLLASALLNPDGFAMVEARLLRALDGPDGLTALSLGFGQRAVALRAVVAAYQAVDEERARTVDTLRWMAGYLVGETIPLTLGVGAVLVAPTALGLTLFGDDVDWERLLTDHPGVVDNLVGIGPGLLSSLPGAPLVSDVPGAAGLIAEFYDDGGFRVEAVGGEEGNVDTTHESMTTPPRGFADLINGLDYRNDKAGIGQPDQIDVRVVTNPDGGTAYIVDIPGTKALNPPWSPDSPYLNDMGTNVTVLGGDTTSRQRAIAEALRMAGAGADDPVMLVGHSQGGMVAAQAAHDSGTAGFPFNVTHVVTAGSPIGHSEVPPCVQVLALENRHDIVPRLDATDNPDEAHRTTVVFESQQGSIAENHGTRSAYLPAASGLDRSTDPSVRAYRDSAGMFLNGESVQARVYNLHRTF